MFEEVREAHTGRLLFEIDKERGLIRVRKGAKNAPTLIDVAEFWRIAPREQEQRPPMRLVREKAG